MCSPAFSCARMQRDRERRRMRHCSKRLVHHPGPARREHLKSHAQTCGYLDDELGGDNDSSRSGFVTAEPQGHLVSPPPQQIPAVSEHCMPLIALSSLRRFVWPSRIVGMIHNLGRRFPPGAALCCVQDSSRCSESRTCWGVG